MSLIRSASALYRGAALVSECRGGSVASAADMPVKAPPPVARATVPLDVHGYRRSHVCQQPRHRRRSADLSRPRASHPGRHRSVDRSLQGPDGLHQQLSRCTAASGTSSGPTRLPAAGPWQEMDWWVGVTVGFAQHWKFSVEYVQFNFPDRAIPTAVQLRVHASATTTATAGCPVTFNPYVNLFYNARGGSTVVLGKTGRHLSRRDRHGADRSVCRSHRHSADADVPDLGHGRSDEFWNRNDGTTNFCGPLRQRALRAEQRRHRLDRPQRQVRRLSRSSRSGSATGTSSAGFQYYHIINDTLLAAQTFAGIGASLRSRRGARHLASATGGIGFTF